MTLHHVATPVRQALLNVSPRWASKVLFFFPCDSVVCCVLLLHDCEFWPFGLKVIGLLPNHVTFQHCPRKTDCMVYTKVTVESHDTHTGWHSDFLAWSLDLLHTLCKLAGVSLQLGVTCVTSPPCLEARSLLSPGGCLGWQHHFGSSRLGSRHALLTQAVSEFCLLLWFWFREQKGGVSEVAQRFGLRGKGNLSMWPRRKTQNIKDSEHVALVKDKSGVGKSARGPEVIKNGERFESRFQSKATGEWSTQAPTNCPHEGVGMTRKSTRAYKCWRRGDWNAWCEDGHYKRWKRRTDCHLDKVWFFFLCAWVQGLKVKWTPLAHLPSRGAVNRVDCIRHAVGKKYCQQFCRQNSGIERTGQARSFPRNWRKKQALITCLKKVVCEMKIRSLLSGEHGGMAPPRASATRAETLDAPTSLEEPHSRGEGCPELAYNPRCFPRRRWVFGRDAEGIEYASHKTTWGSWGYQWEGGGDAQMDTERRKQDGQQTGGNQLQSAEAGPGHGFSESWTRGFWGVLVSKLDGY